MWTGPHSSQAERAAELQPAEVGDGGAPADRRQGAVVAIAERPGRRLAGEPRAAARARHRRPAAWRRAPGRAAACRRCPAHARYRRCRRSRDDRARVRSGPTTTRPARSFSAPSQCAADEAATPAAQTMVAAASGSSPMVTPSASHCVTGVPSRTSTPSRSSDASAAALSFAGKRGSTRGPASTSTMRASRGSMLRKSWRSATRASSAMAPAISTPVGPPPITTKVSKRRRARARRSPRRFSKAVRMRRRIAGGVVDLLQAGRHAAPIRRGRNRRAARRSRPPACRRTARGPRA